MINKIFTFSVLTTLIVLYASWELKSFPILMISAIVILIGIAVKFTRIRVTTVPILIITILLTIAEFIIPILQPRNDTRVDLNSGHANGYWERIEGFGYRPNHGTHSSTKLTSTDEVIYDVVYNIGADGYRADIDIETYDAYIYGGSFIFGEGLNDDETLTYFLYDNHQIATKNVGVQGYGLHQALYNIENGVTSDRPNSINILLTSPWHALRSSCKHQSSTGTPRYRLKNNVIILDGVCPNPGIVSRIQQIQKIHHVFLKKSNVYKLIRLALFNDVNIISDNDLELWVEIIKEISRLSKKNHATLVIAYIDSHEHRLSETSWTNEALLNRLSLISDIVVDVTLSDTREDLNSQFYIHEFDQHPSAQANEHRAQIIADAIKMLVTHE